ncbi:diacylglycerol/lipid kinase family protein [Asticcacaulis solisilvae]|uniref:diacylglycerol/lipid kinase family protein n=1 Tax=Asticcacaulis solisilvae TaxID=1217274 RepID=UPI003FD8FCAF
MAGKGFNILINRRSGTVLNMGEAAVEAAIHDSGLEVAELCLSEPDAMSENLDRFIKSTQPLLIGGGDGTIRESAKVLAEHGKAFGVLPFGTMNLLPHDLGIDTLQQALKAYAQGVRTDAIDAGYVNGELFLCCASIGTMPQASVYREQKRDTSKVWLVPQLFMFILDNLDRHKRERIVLDVDGVMARFHAPAVVVSANRFADSDKLTESNFKRHTLDGGELAAYVMTTKTKASHVRVLMRLLFGHWLRDPDLKEMTGQRIKLWSRHKKALVSIDGEVEKLRTPLEFTLKPRHVKVLVPEAG